MDAAWPLWISPKQKWLFDESDWPARSHSGMVCKQLMGIDECEIQRFSGMKSCASGSGHVTAQPHPQGPCIAPVNEAGLRAEHPSSTVDDDLFAMALLILQSEH